MESAPLPTDSLTSAQQRAVLARGNVLVMAGAGTGKTKTLVARCLDCLDRDRASLDELLIVTFTEAAAAEMRLRLRRELEKKADAHPADEHWPRQLALFDLAPIGTLHGFCLQLVREHFHELGLDPQLTILDEGKTRQLANETLDEQFAAHYEDENGESEFSRAVRNLIETYGNGRDEKIRALVLRLHNYSQTRPDAAGWLAQQIKIFSATEPVEWQHWLLTAIQGWRNEWLPILENLKTENEKAAELLAILLRLKSAPANSFSRELAAEVLEQTVSADGNWPNRRKTVLRQPLTDFFDEAGFLSALASIKNGSDPLVEDWTWTHRHMAALLQLAQEFAKLFADRKRADGVLDFHDLEQFALKLLWDFPNDKPTPIAEVWRAKLRFVFVDEYQDINAAQDKIIAALARADADANRFLVGDVKQSIYRFRLADPKIFRDYAESWRSENQRGPGETISLSENFRSREGLLDFVNSLFRLIMREETGGIHYDAAAELKFGKRWGERPREPLLPTDATAREDTRPTGSAKIGLRTELFLRLKKKPDDPVGDDENDDLADLDEAQKEARTLAARLRQLVADKHEIRDEAQKKFRVAGFGDMAILLRSPRAKAEIYAKEFERAGIPLAIARGGFYESSEVLDLLSLLELLDNPLQDLPCLAVLRSPFVGLSLAELAEIRLAFRDGFFWTALNRVQNLPATVRAQYSVLAAEQRLVVAHGETVGESSKKTPAPDGANEISTNSLSATPAGTETPIGAEPTVSPWATSGRNSVAEQNPLATKIPKFLAQFARWRKLAKQVSLSQCLEEILAETFYADWLRAQSRGEQRAANVTQFLQLAQSFDQFQRAGLFRFLQFIKAQREIEAEPEVSAAAAGNAVRLMSIHQSKGLEFPIVAVADLGKNFNEQDLNSEIIFDEIFGLCPQVKPPVSGRRYPSLPHWLAQKNQKRELRGEELRLLYVAFTRARDTLILSAAISEKKWNEVWNQPEPAKRPKISDARNFADWLGIWFSGQNPKPQVQGETGGEFENLRWRILEATESVNELSEISGEPQITSADYVGELPSRPFETLDHFTAEKLRAVLSWEYPHKAATERKAKASVTELRRAAAETDDEAEKPFSNFKFQNWKAPVSDPTSGPTAVSISRIPPPAPGSPHSLTAAQIGTAHHKFLQHVSLAKSGDLPMEAERLARENFLSAAECAVLDLAALAQFWNSPLGGKIRAQPENSVHRELPFTARFRPEEIAVITRKPADATLTDEFIVVQGVADLVVLRADEIWLVDFKTDEIHQGNLPEKIKAYAPQLQLYAAALEKIFSRKVTRRALHFLATGRTEEV